MNRNEGTIRSRAAWGWFFPALLPLCGCQVTPDPFKDELAGQRSVTTASVDAVHAAGVSPAVVEAQGQSKPLPCIDGAVTHLPLYFEDPFEDTGSDDGKFAWTGEDYLWMFYWRGRYLVNAVSFPVSAVVDPPWAIMVSDGRPSPRAFGEKHDAVRVRPESEPAEPEQPPSDGS